jgi:two-component system cell cycle sensor histidine kinase/response regulator CckA
MQQRLGAQASSTSTAGPGGSAHPRDPGQAASTSPSEQRYRTLFEYSPDGILIADREGRCLDANQSICRMLGYTGHELLGLDSRDILVEPQVPGVGSAIRSIIATSDYHAEWQLRRKDGTVIPVDVMATLMPDGNILAMVRDITARNEADESLRRTEERTRFALQHAHVGVWDMDYRSGLLQWSDVMEAQYGVAPGTFEGRFDAFIERIHPDDRAAVLEALGNATKTGTDFFLLNRTTRADGEVRWLNGTGRILLDERGQPLHAVGVSQDVTERQSLEAQFHQAQKMEAVGRLAGGVAHDFNNLLTVILGFSEMWLESADPGDPQRFEITEIYKAGRRASELTRQLLAFSRQQIIEPTLLDLNAILTDMRPMLARLIREDVKVVLHVGTGVARIKADRGQVEQILINLAVNAQDAMLHGGTLTIEAANTELDEHYATMHFAVKPGPYVVLTVTDSGTGMTPEVRAHLFEPFFTTKEVGKGTGLGLATIHGIVTRNGGSVRVETELGRGSSFKVYFPQAAPSEAVAGVAPESAPPRTGTETVLVVEDAEGLRELTRRVLEKQGYIVLVAGHAAEAVQIFDENPSIAVILTDVVMPGPSGPELIRQLVERRPTVEVIYMSGYTDDAIVQHGVLKPGIAFLHKPFTAQALGRKLREVLDRKTH